MPVFKKGVAAPLMTMVIVEPAAKVSVLVFRSITLSVQLPEPVHCVDCRLNMVASLPGPKSIVPLLVMSVPVPLLMINVLLVLSPWSTPPAFTVRSPSRLLSTLRITVAPLGMTTLSPLAGTPPQLHVDAVPQLRGCGAAVVAVHVAPSADGPHASAQ